MARKKNKFWEEIWTVWLTNSLPCDWWLLAAMEGLQLVALTSSTNKRKPLLPSSLLRRALSSFYYKDLFYFFFMGKALLSVKHSSKKYLFFFEDRLKVLQRFLHGRAEASKAVALVLAVPMVSSVARELIKMVSQLRQEAGLVSQSEEELERKLQAIDDFMHYLQDWKQQKCATIKEKNDYVDNQLKDTNSPLSLLFKDEQWSEKVSHLGLTRYGLVNRLLTLYTEYINAVERAVQVTYRVIDSMLHIKPTDFQESFERFRKEVNLDRSILRKIRAVSVALRSSVADTYGWFIGRINVPQVGDPSLAIKELEEIKILEEGFEGLIPKGKLKADLYIDCSGSMNSGNKNMFALAVVYELKRIGVCPDGVYLFGGENRSSKVEPTFLDKALINKVLSPSGSTHFLPVAEHILTRHLPAIIISDMEATDYFWKTVEENKDWIEVLRQRGYFIQLKIGSEKESFTENTRRLFNELYSLCV